MYVWRRTFGECDVVAPAQTEKQRIIWAYKILFLDVLVPLNLKKVCTLFTRQL